MPFFGGSGGSSGGVPRMASFNLPITLIAGGTSANLIPFFTTLYDPDGIGISGNGALNVFCWNIYTNQQPSGITGSRGSALIFRATSAALPTNENYAQFRYPNNTEGIGFSDLWLSGTLACPGTVTTVQMIGVNDTPDRFIRFGDASGGSAVNLTVISYD